MSDELRYDLPLPYLLREPEAGSGPAPVVVLLHGYGSTAEGMMTLAPYLDERFLVLAPQALRPLWNGGWGWYPLGQGPVAPVLDVDELEESRRGVLEFAEAAAEVYGADPDRLYLMGFSQGAALALAAALTEPERLAGLVAMSGRVVPEILPRIASPERIRRLPVMLTHGMDDEIVPVSQGRATRALLEGWGGQPAYREYPVAHTLSAEGLLDVNAWLRGALERPRRPLDGERAGFAETPGAPAP